ncbi:MAG TPA: GntR family transcriptional regulator [Candidatus Hydrogenedens sp.]|nr:GntR family transcriptional regulator [Candidatus Hydrogenedens sp.]
MIRLNKRERLKFVKEDLINKILDHHYPPGTDFPSEKMLMQEYGLTRGYVRQILHELQLEGYLISSQGKRTKVCSPDNYSPYPITSEKTTFAIAMQDQQTNHTQRILQGFMEIAGKNLIQTISYNLYFDIHTEQKFLRNIKRTGIHGFAFWAHFNNEHNCELLQKLTRSHFPVVLVDRYLPQISIDAVVSDNEYIGEKLTETLIRRGHKRIAFISAELDSTSAFERYKGYKNALEKNHIAFNDSFLAVGYEDKLPALLYKLLAMKIRPTAMVFSYDSLAWIAYQEITKLGYKVPDEMEFATLGDEGVAQTHRFPAWMFCQSSIEMGRIACEKLIQRMQMPDKPYEVVKLLPQPSEPQLFEP